MKKWFPQCSFEDAIADLPAQSVSIIMVILPCVTLWLNRRIIASFPEVVSFLPLLLTHASYLAIGVYAAIAEAKKEQMPRDWPARMRYHLRLGTFGAAPFAGLVVVLGLLYRPFRPVAIVSAFTILLSTVIAILVIATLTFLVEEYQLPFEVVGGPLTAASLFGTVITTYMIMTRLMYRLDG